MFGLRPGTSRARCSPASRSLCARRCPGQDPPACACAGSLFTLLLHGPEYACNGSRELIPPARLDCALSPAFGRQFVELGAPIVLGSAFLGGYPSSFDETVQRRIQRPLLNLQNVLGVEFNHFGNGVTMPRAHQKRPQN